MELLVFVGSLVILMPLGIPIAVILVACSFILMFYMGIFDPSIIGQQMVMGSNNFPLMAIPFFMLAGELMSSGGLSTRIVSFANLLVGRIRGGLGYVAVLASILFAGLSGSAVADAAALGSILVPMMRANGYKPERAAGVICAGAIIAAIIPPSIPMIVLGSSVGLSISRMFMSGIVPGLILGLALLGTWFIIVRIDGYQDTGKKLSWIEAKAILKDSVPALVMPVMIIGGIRFGVFTPTESGAFAAIYALCISIFWYRELRFADLGRVFVATAKSTAVVMFIVSGASAIGWFITVAQIPMKLADVLSVFMDSPLALLVVMNIFMLAIGMVMDLTPNLLIFGPVFLPVIVKAGIDPYFFALLMIFNLCIGLITPPVGTILFLGCGMADVSLGKMIKGIMPFVVVEIALLIVFILVPQLILVPLKMIVG